MEHKVTITKRIYQETADAIEQAAQANDRSFASMAKLLVDTGLEQLRALKQTARNLKTYAKNHIHSKDRSN